MRGLFVVFATAVCLLSLLKLKWPKKSWGILTSFKERGGLNSFISPTAPSPLRYRGHEKLNCALISFFFLALFFLQNSQTLKPTAMC